MGEIMFWSGETLKANLDKLIFNADRKAIGNAKKVDCAAYTLTIGPEIYITPSMPSTEPKGHQKIRLEKNEDFRIPSGQFAFLISEEFIKVPQNVIAFISLKTRTLKFKGLINVSGFHVDPGYDGRIVFSVFNAGPQQITLKRGQDFAMIWFASLDNKNTQEFYRKPGESEISIELMSAINGEVFSPMAIKDRLQKLEDDFKQQSEKTKWTIIGIMLVILLGTFVNLSAGWIKDHFFASKSNVFSVGGSEIPIQLQLNSTAAEAQDDNRIQENKKPSEATSNTQDGIKPETPLKDAP